MRSEAAPRAATASRELDSRDDQELAAIVQSEPPDSPQRSAACEILIGRYQGLVRSCARRYRGAPEPEDDLTQVGYLGLLKAINNFDPARGSTLTAYALPCVSGEIKRYFRDKRWQIRVKRSAQELRLQLRDATAELTHELARAPRDDELAAHLDISTEDLRDAQHVDQLFQVSSLDAPLSGETGTASLADLIGDDDPGIEHLLDIEAVWEHWHELPERDQRLLTMRFYGNMTQAEIGQQLGISQMHVSRLLAGALGYLRERLMGLPHGACAGAG